MAQIAMPGGAFDALAQEIREQTETVTGVAIRMRCVEAVAEMYHGTGGPALNAAAVVIAEAEQLYRWVIGPAQPENEQ